MILQSRWEPGASMSFRPVHAAQGKFQFGGAAKLYVMSLEAACGMFFWRTCTVATKLCLGYFSCLIPNQYIHSFNSSMHRFSGSKGPTIRQLGLVIFTVKWTKRVLRSIRQSCTPNFDCSYIYIFVNHCPYKIVCFSWGYPFHTLPNVWRCFNGLELLEVSTTTS